MLCTFKWNIDKGKLMAILVINFFLYETKFDF